MQADHLVAELLAHGDMNDETTLELNRMLADWRADKLDPEDAAYIEALHAKIMHGPAATEDMGDRGDPVRLDGLSIEEWRDRALRAETSLADLEAARLNP